MLCTYTQCLFCQFSTKKMQISWISHLKLELKVGIYIFSRLYFIVFIETVCLHVGSNWWRIRKGKPRQQNRLELFGLASIFQLLLQFIHIFLTNLCHLKQILFFDWMSDILLRKPATTIEGMLRILIELLFSLFFIFH